MAKPHVGDLGYVVERGRRVLGIVIGHGPNDTIHFHAFGPSHENVEPDQFHKYEVTDDGNIPNLPPPPPPPPPKERAKW